MSVKFTPEGWEDYTSWKDPKAVRRINRLIADIQRDPAAVGLGKPEILRGLMSGWSSRRIDEEHRLVYRIRGEVLEIAACAGHYSGM
nr:Txe/YoeB family addiction module toxin [Actinoplanes derwentensis]